VLLRSHAQDPPNARPFVLSRSFYAGSQRWGAIWTGDNAARWDHLEISAPMLLTIGASGLPFAGADVGGFFGNCDAELVTRWTQAGAYQPFFRGHAHHDSARREPWLFGDETLSRLRSATMERYQLLPYWYTQFHTASLTGLPTMRPMWMEFPTNSDVVDMDKQWMVGRDLMVCPVLSPRKTSVQCYFPAENDWYNVRNFQKEDGKGDRTVQAPADQVRIAGEDQPHEASFGGGGRPSEARERGG
jgi:alpha 1,3-glucosidase